jgi:2-polyprenyl-6-methoxyphenol hydroxylase-like FAD-dependent oxidoreductase
VARSRTIAIAGAGIGGLTAALALAARGFRIVLLEKAERLEEVGAGLQLSPNASRVLIDLGLRARLEQHAIAPDAVHIMSARSGGELMRLPLGDAAAFRAGAPYWVMRRADLQSALLAAVNDHPDIDLRLGRPLDAFGVHAGGVVTGESDRALALIGADGVWSMVRQQMFPDVKPRFSGLIAWRGSIDASRLQDQPPERQVQLWMGSNAHLVAYPMAGGRQVNVVAILPGAFDSESWRDGGDAAELRAHFAAMRWPDSARAMLGAVDDWRRWPLFTLRDGGAWSQGPVALLGDAAHAMLPFAAQGAGMAIEDAAVLAQCLSEATDIAPALQRYAAMRRPRVRRVQRTARQSGKIYHLHGPMALARDLTMQALGVQRLQARQDWIHDWKA